MFSTSIHSLITGKSSACLDSAIPALPGKSVRIASAVRECNFYFTYRPASCLKYSVREHYAYVSKNVLVACFVQPRVSLNELYIPATCHEIFNLMTVTIKRILYIYNHDTTNSMPPETFIERFMCSRAWSTPNAQNDVSLFLLTTNFPVETPQLYLDQTRLVTPFELNK